MSRTEIIQVQRVKDDVMPQGEYTGTWNGYVIEIETKDEWWMLKTKTGIRGIAPVKVTVDAAGKIEVTIHGEAS